MDLVLWLGMFGLIYWIKSLTHQVSHLEHLSVVGIPLGVSLVAAWLVGGYDRESDFFSLRFASEFVLGGILAAFAGAGLSALVGTYGSSMQTSRMLLILAPVGYTFSALYLRRSLEPVFGRTATTARRILVLGTPEDGAAILTAMAIVGKAANVRVVALNNGATEASLRKALDAETAVQKTEHALDSIVLGREVRQLDPGLSEMLVVLHSNAVPVFVWGAFWQQRLRMLDVMDPSPCWLFDRDFRLARFSVYSHVKRLADVLLASIGLLATSPLLLLIWLAIRVTSPGKGVFQQDRYGYRGWPFTIYKFRTMKMDSEKAGTTTASADPRITRIGKFLRKSRLDELPQLWNVLKGEMSLVGPRPEWSECIKDYENEVPYYHLRHLVKPGITGWAQVNYPYGQDVEDARNKLAFDLYYVKNASMILDCSIILKTLHVIVGRVGGR
ncbi:MAG: exopolysaccharide biosynthesis polyprenyl glycosylphosphotransferase [Verrucomicrobiales bacterium]|nr:exopolysaccharide biosynthesis polyprenyl glycosylphosphotransferase [Verrucomicrobiales bacterium]